MRKPSRKQLKARFQTPALDPRDIIADQVIIELRGLVGGLQTQPDRQYCTIIVPNDEPRYPPIPADVQAGLKETIREQRPNKHACMLITDHRPKLLMGYIHPSRVGVFIDSRNHRVLALVQGNCNGHFEAYVPFTVIGDAFYCEVLPLSDALRLLPAV